MKPEFVWPTNPPQERPESENIQASSTVNVPEAEEISNYWISFSNSGASNNDVPSLAHDEASSWNTKAPTAA